MKKLISLCLVLCILFSIYAGFSSETTTPAPVNVAYPAVVDETQPEREASLSAPLPTHFAVVDSGAPRTSAEIPDVPAVLVAGNTVPSGEYWRSRFYECQNASSLDLDHLRARIVWLEAELAVLGSDIGGTVADWLSVLRPDERPSDELVRRLTEHLQAYPVALTVDEGLWIVERIELQDWTNYGETVDEVLIGYLGAGRIAAELSPAELAPLQELWADEGMFQ